MSGVTVGWDETDPADTKNLGLGAGDIRSTKTNLRGALDAEHLWPSAGGYSGVHRAGSARAFYGTVSQVSSSDTDGRLMVTSNGSKLHHVGSADTICLGSRYVTHGGGLNLTHLGAQFRSGVTQAFCVESGVGRMVTSSASTAISLTASYVTALGVVTRQVANTDATITDVPMFIGMITGSASAAVASYSIAGTQGAPTSNYTFSWIVFGITALTNV